MISKSMNLQEWNKPLLLRPVGKDYLWGGERLRTEFGKELQEHPLAETWECSTHPDGLSVVGSGCYCGCTLSELLQLYPEWKGQRHKDKEQLPILIKMIDAAKDLSVQVHPDDAYAAVHENQAGKTEMWYVLDAEPGAELIYGFSHDVTAAQLRESLAEGKLLSHLQKIPVKKNDVFFIRPGTVHAIGKGVLIAEIQESSNVTYRVYDYDRIDKNGKKRELHVEKALDILNLKYSGEVRQQMRLMRYQPGSAWEILCRCQYFQVNRVLVTECFKCKVENISFQVLLLLEGEADIGDLHVRKGDCVFLPADCGEVVVRGKGQLLQVMC